MTTKAEELALEYIKWGGGGALHLATLMATLEQYGRLVQEAAAKICDSRDDAENNCMEPAILAEAIREMRLP